MASERTEFVPGMTPRAFCASVFAMLLAGIYTQYSEVILSEGNAVAEQILPVPAMSVLLLLLVLSGAFYAIFKLRLLTRAEILCVFFTMVISIPIMTQGMWHRFVGLISSTPRSAAFDYLDAYNENLWPHGENLLSGLLAKDAAKTGGGVEWSEVEFEKGRKAELPALENKEEGAVSTVSMEVPVAVGGSAAGFIPGNPYLISVLARTEDMAPGSRISCRVYSDGGKDANEIFSAPKAERKTFIHQTGFVRLGAYGAKVAEDCRGKLRVEFVLHGRGRVVFADPQLMSVAALEGIFRGRKMIAESEYKKLPPESCPPDLIIKPDNMWSVAGAKFLLSGYIPLREWVRPALTWSVFVLLLATACLAMNVIMRKQWAESERYPFPNARIPSALIGVEDSAQGAFSSILSNRYTWAGFSVAFLWGMAKCWHTFNSNVPDLSANINFAPYFQDPGWGWTWQFSAGVNIFFVSIAIFFELNVLLSLLIGFCIYRVQGWLGESTGLKVNAGYPWRYHQAIGGYIGYFIIVIFFTRKYLWGVAKAAFRGGKDDPYELMSSRNALLTLSACFAGALAWGWFLQISLLSISVYMSFLLLVGFVASKIRAECGLICGYFTPYNAMLLISILGGMAVFGASGMMVTLLLSGFLTVSVFFMIPGAQLELIQLGHRMRIRPLHITATCVMGILGGLFIGGWVFLSNAYAIGGDNIKYQWSFSQHWFFSSYISELANTTAGFLRADSGGAAAKTTDLGTWTAVLWAGVTMILTTIRQYLPGFWFHPVGFILGSSHMIGDWTVGSVLVAWVIRATVLKFGGATSVRNKLQPFFVGALVGAVVVMVICLAINSISIAQGGTLIHGQLP